MTFTVTIDEDKAEEILNSASFCYEEGMGGDLSFLLGRIKQYFPDLWSRYSYLEKSF